MPCSEVVGGDTRFSLIGELIGFFDGPKVSVDVVETEGAIASG
jgi:hypothetical protein